MDPRGVGLRRFATHMLKFRPGADVSMLNAIMHTIVEEGLYDRQYIEAYTENWEAEKAHLANFTPEKMEPICGIPAEELRQVAREFAGAKSGMIFWGMGVSQHIHGTDNSRCLISLALMCGHVGRPGTGLHPLRGQNNVQGASDAGLIPMFLPDYQTVTDDSIRGKFSGVWGSGDFSNEKGLTVTEILDAVHHGDIKGMYILGENPAMSDPDLNHARDALGDARTPRRAGHLPDRDGELCRRDPARRRLLREERHGHEHQPAGADRPRRRDAPGRGARGLGDHHGAGEPDRAWAGPMSHPSEVFAEMKQTMKSLDNITWERLEKEGAVTYPSLSPEDPGQPIVFGSGFPRAGGRARFTPASVISPAELPDTEYPMIMTTGRQLEHWHTGSMTRRSAVLDAVEPEANCSLHPDTLKRLGVMPGERIRLSTRRGSIEIMARADRAIAEDMVFVPFAYVEAAANVLTNPALDPYGKIPEFKFAAVKVEKIATDVAAE